MKKLTTFLISILFALSVYGQEYINGKPVYRNYGKWSIEVEGNEVGVQAYVTKERIYNEIKKQYIQKSEPENLYRYELYLVSKSVYRGEITKTWLYSARVFINGVEATKEQFPEGFTVSVDIEPTMVYWYQIASEKIELAITWENAIYENRTR